MKRLELRQGDSQLGQISAEGVLCELARRQKVGIRVFPVCAKRTLATGDIVHETLNRSTDLGPPLCPGIRIIETPLDTALPCNEYDVDE